ncbi:MAG TPA: hypothetical protein PLJ21_11990, partial [Pseudobdellovibrionaceae bacterium]|nr:hypothetical protein [Pseudobdellovibrionaceae bacterium]
MKRTLLSIFSLILVLSSNAKSLSGELRIKPQEGRIMIDNDAAFLSKIEAIRSAKADETLRLIYYIYATDESSSAFSLELLKAAQRGVKVELLVDLLTNYKNIDLFHYLEKKSNGAIQVRFFGRPSSKITRDIVFMSRPCPESLGPVTAKQCSTEKWKNLSSNNLDFYSQMLLSGLFAKHPLALKTGFVMGQILDLEMLKKGETTEEEQEQLKEFLKLLFQAQFKKDLQAALKVKIA